MKRFEVTTSMLHGLIGFKTPRGYNIIYSEPLVIPMLILIAEDGSKLRWNKHII